VVVPALLAADAALGFTEAATVGGAGTGVGFVAGAGVALGFTEAATVGAALGFAGVDFPNGKNRQYTRS